MKWSADLLEKKIKIKFKNQNILKRALVHRSFLNENRKIKQSNERLEFLGDAVLELITSQLLFEKFPKKPEGKLTSLRSRVVQTKTLAQAAKNINLGKFLKMSRGEKLSGGEKNISLLADTFEALIGAIYLDQGYEKTKDFVYQSLFKNLEKITKSPETCDYKSILQEKIQSQNQPSPLYKIIKASGPDHNRTFTAAVFFFEKEQGKGNGKSKQEAEQKAAKKALEKINKKE
jgi:ribonuclease-3